MSLGPDFLPSCCLLGGEIGSHHLSGCPFQVCALGCVGLTLQHLQHQGSEAGLGRVSEAT